MATPKPKWGYTWVGFGKFRPSDEDMTTLMKNISDITEIKHTARFEEVLRRLSIMLQKQRYDDVNAPNKEELLEELNQLIKALKRVDGIFSHKGMSESMRFQFVQKMMPAGLTGEKDPIYATHYGAHTLLGLALELQQSMKKHKKPKEYSFTQTRLKAAEELARALNEDGVKPSATEFGIFHEVLDIFLDFNDLHLEDSAKIMKAAVKNYPTKPMWSILREGMKYPGLTG